MPPLPNVPRVTMTIPATSGQRRTVTLTLRAEGYSKNAPLHLVAWARQTNGAYVALDQTFTWQKDETGFPVELDAKDPPFDPSLPIATYAVITYDWVTVLKPKGRESLGGVDSDVWVEEAP